jgi:hypothetical protein
MITQTGYLLGMPVASYSLDIGRAHTDFAEGKLQQRLIERQLDDTQINQFSIISMAGVAAEATQYDEVALKLPHLHPFRFPGRWLRGSECLLVPLKLSVRGGSLLDQKTSRPMAVVSAEAASVKGHTLYSGFLTFIFLTRPFLSDR